MAPRDGMRKGGGGENPGWYLPTDIPPTGRPTPTRLRDARMTRDDPPRRAPTAMTQKVAVLGTGKIGEALLSGMIRSGWPPADLLVTTRRQERAEELRTRHGVTPVSNQEAAKTADTLILTVKPQDMGVLLDELAPTSPPTA
ncbi:hypothetical protein SHKM778_05590 [Streptomyces sp. KM77-8]|uniref:Pyrroline-5-carboxylate reductase catalytic N-terminal domain-containing protein n=1 Tax=Streptomyces haneummycinicus TaxID=3074435 RepID=A0AAT9H9T1_9ACTN